MDGVVICNRFFAAGDGADRRAAGQGATDRAVGTRAVDRAIGAGATEPAAGRGGMKTFDVRAAGRRRGSVVAPFAAAKEARHG
jgi:hypothetical protein